VRGWLGNRLDSSQLSRGRKHLERDKYFHRLQVKWRLTYLKINIKRKKGRKGKAGRSCWVIL
jgi:hypothetical protein